MISKDYHHLAERCDTLADRIAHIVIGILALAVMLFPLLFIGGGQ